MTLSAQQGYIVSDEGYSLLMIFISDRKTKICCLGVLVKM